jgi:plastocyanin
MNIRTDSFEAFEGGRSVMMRYTQKVRTRAMLRVLLTVLVLAAVLGFVSTGAADQGTAQAADPSVTIDLVAHDIAFNTSKITVPAGAEVTVHFKNEDAGIPHNFAVYETRAAEHAIFRGNHRAELHHLPFHGAERTGNVLFPLRRAPHDHEWNFRGDKGLKRSVGALYFFNRCLSRLFAAGNVLKGKNIHRRGKTPSSRFLRSVRCSVQNT